jgi:protein-tyrosine phosphatase
VTGRLVQWGTLHNVRDLGGLPTPNGLTRPGRVFRSPSPDDLTAAGWQKVHDDGVRTLIDLRNDYEVGRDTSRPAVLSVLRRPVEDQTDTGFMATWGDKLGSPAYYPEILLRWPDLVADVFAAIADAPDGAVLIHCVAGRDRTGMISAMLFELVGVDRASIYADYAAAVRDDNLWLVTSPPNRREGPKSDEELDEQLRTAQDELATFLDAFEVETFLVGSGVSREQIRRIQSRLLDD